jgi:hypothetical protein
MLLGALSAGLKAKNWLLPTPGSLSRAARASYRMEARAISRRVHRAPRRTVTRGPRRSGVPTAKCIESVFEFPFLAHATMEPMNITVSAAGKRVVTIEGLAAYAGNLLWSWRRRNGGDRRESKGIGRQRRRPCQEDERRDRSGLLLSPCRGCRGEGWSGRGE